MCPVFDTNSVSSLENIHYFMGKARSRVVASYYLREDSSCECRRIAGVSLRDISFGNLAGKVDVILPMVLKRLFYYTNMCELAGGTFRTNLSLPILVEHHGFS
ncbi:unnamed protein product [Calypogeia fissa]